MKKIFTLVMACAVALAASAELKQWSVDQVSNNGATTTVKEDGTIVIDFANPAYVQDYNGEFMINAQNSDWYATIDLYASSLVGHYTTSDFDSFYTNMMSWVTFDSYYLGEIDFTCAIVDGNYDMNFTLESDGQKFQVHMYAPAPPEGALEYDTQTGSVDYTYTSENEINVIDRHDMGEKDVVIQMMAADGSNGAVFRLFLDEADPETIIPDGTYEINHSAASGTVAASTGVGSDNVIQPSYFAVLRSGKITKPYFITSGTVTVTNTKGGMAIDVDAKNSWNVPVKLHYVPEFTGINDIAVESSKVVKTIENGQVVIEKDGAKYNAAGARIK
ncbi:MAG: hypothetical protein MJZ74_07180 [Muribaculaceae bacterium]|nr:hypothetical protein [Muribaculaceae bacterium]